MNREYFRLIDGRYYIDHCVNNILDDLGVLNDGVLRYSTPYTVTIDVYPPGADISGYLPLGGNIGIHIYDTGWNITERYGIFVKREHTNPSMDVIVDWCSKYIPMRKL